MSTSKATARAVETLLGMPRLFQSLCDPTRLHILCELLQSGAPRTVTSIAASCPVDTSVVSRHLRALLEVGVLSREKQGKEAYYRVEARALARTLRSIADAIDRCCGGGESREDR
jgi:ArsR family transcriptional regulator